MVKMHKWVLIESISLMISVEFFIDDKISLNVNIVIEMKGASTLIVNEGVNLKKKKTKKNTLAKYFQIQQRFSCKLKKYHSLLLV